MQKGILTQSNYTLVNKSVIKSEVGGNLSIASTVPDYANFKKVRREIFYFCSRLTIVFVGRQVELHRSSFCYPGSHSQQTRVHDSDGIGNQPI